MKQQIDIEVGSDGKIRMMYQEGIEEFAQEMGGEISTTCRLTHVEPEGNGWSVRSAYDNDFAIRHMPNKQHWFIPSTDKSCPVFIFKNRDSGIEAELAFFKEFLEVAKKFNQEGK